MKFINPGKEGESSDNIVFPDGLVEVKKIRYFGGEKHQNDKEQPMLVLDGLGRLVARFNFVLIDDKDGPAMSIRLCEVPLLVKAFGGKLKSLGIMPNENEPDKISNYLEKASQLVSESNKTTKAFSENGWVNNISSVFGMEVPPGVYGFVLSGVSPKNNQGEVYFRTKEQTARGGGKYESKFFFCEFTVVSDENGEESLFNRAPFSLIVTFSLIENENGNIDGLKNNDGVEYAASTKRLFRLFSLTAPSLVDAEGHVDMNVNSLEEVLPNWEKAIDKSIILEGEIARSKNLPDKNNKRQANTEFRWYSLDLAEFDVDFKVESEGDIDSDARDILIALFEKLNSDKPIYKNGSLTAAGKGLAKVFITPVKEQGNVFESKVGLDELEVQEVFYILDYMKTQTKKKKLKMVEEAKENLEFLSIGKEVHPF